jgi:hypothetical protein
MRFCQTDGAPLIEMSGDEVNDPYKTTVGRQEDLASAIPPDPFKTIVGGGSPKKDDSNDLLQLSEDQDSLKTMFISDEEMKREMAGDQPKRDSIVEVPPLGDSSSNAEIRDSSSASNYSEPSLSAPSFGDFSSGSSPADAANSEDTSKTYATAFDQESSDKVSNNPFDNSSFNQPSAPIPSPFSESKTSSFDQPSTPLPDYKEPKPLNDRQNDPFSQSPFGQYSAPANQPLQQTEWTPPPAPEADWQNQEIGSNTPFQPPTAGAGQNQTLAIVSLVLGIIGIVLCQFTAPAALVTGFMARNKAAQNPSEYGGSGLALAGIITGAIGTLLLVLVVIYFIFIFGILFTR